MNTVLRSASVLVLAAAAFAARAAPVAYTESGVGSGTLDGTAFSNVAFTITGVADTSSVTYSTASSNFYSVLVQSPTVFVTGIGSDALTDVINVSDNQTYSSAGFGDTTTGMAILFTTNPTFGSYDLKSTIGPLSGSGNLNQFSSFTTSRGTFNVSLVSTTAFQARVQATPEPSALAALGLGAVALVKRRKRA